VAEFEELAVAPAQDAERHRVLRRRLEENRLNALLVDTEALTLPLETAYSAMHERHQASLLREHIGIARLLR
jgi:predicted O-linked N-acetylglucosamine transferase (SPINDLY family)